MKYIKETQNLFKNVVEDMSNNEKNTSNHKNFDSISIAEYVRHVQDKYETLNNKGKSMIIVNILYLLNYKDDVTNAETFNHNCKLIRNLIPNVNFALLFDGLKLNEYLELLKNIEYSIDTLIDYNFTKKGEVMNFEYEAFQKKLNRTNEGE